MTRSSYRFDPKKVQPEVDAVHTKGKKVKSKHSSPEMKTGDKGTVVSHHTGTYYGVSTGGGVVYLPAQHVEPDNDEKNGPPDGDADDAPAP